MKSSIIKLNVGGVRYDVSQSLLDRFPCSMLSKLVSDTWIEGAMDEDTKEVFIDRNGERFQYVMDYMRDGVVELPMSIPRGQLVMDMNYFGIDYQDCNITLSVANPKDLFHCLGRYRIYFTEKEVEIEARYRAVAAEKLANDIAMAFFSQLQRDKEFSRKYVTTDVPTGKYFEPLSVRVPMSSSHRDIKPKEIAGHLADVGLKIVAANTSRFGSATEGELFDRGEVQVALLE